MNRVFHLPLQTWAKPMLKIAWRLVMNTTFFPCIYMYITYVEINLFKSGHESWGKRVYTFLHSIGPAGDDLISIARVAPFSVMLIRPTPFVLCITNPETLVNQRCSMDQFTNLTWRIRVTINIQFSKFESWNQKKIVLPKSWRNHWQQRMLFFLSTIFRHPEYTAIFPKHK